MRSSRDSQISRSRLRTLMVGVTTRVTEPRCAALRLTAAAPRGRPGRAIRHPHFGRPLEFPVCVRRGGRDVDGHFYLFPAAAVAVERSMTLSMKTYSQASSALNH